MQCFNYLIVLSNNDCKQYILCYNASINSRIALDAFQKGVALYDISQNRRHYRRVECRNSVRFKLKGSAEPSGCLAQDISDGGIKINLNDFVPLNSEINVEVQLAAQRIVDCVAKIVWIEKMPFMDRYQAGLEFDDERIEKEAKLRIHAYTHSN